MTVSHPNTTRKVDGMTATLERPTVTDPGFTVRRAEFADAAATVARALPSRPPVPILAGARLTVASDLLTIAGFDYETSTEVTIPCEGSADGVVIVSGNLLAQIAKSLPDKPVTVTVDGPKAILMCGSSRFTLPTMNGDDYPALPELPAISGTVESHLFARAIDTVKAGVSNDDALPMLAGIRVEFTHDTITMAATDRFRLAVKTIPWTCVGEPPAPILVPGKSLVEAARGVDQPVQLAVGEGVLGVRHGRTDATMRLLDAEFPKFANLLPAEHAAVGDVDVASLEQAVKRAALVAERGVRVALTFTTGTLTVASGDDGSASTEQVPATYRGDTMTIAFNPQYLLAGLATIDTDNVLIGMAAPSRPAVLAPNHAGIPDAGPVHNGHVYLIMPVRLPG